MVVFLKKLGHGIFLIRDVAGRDSTGPVIAVITAASLHCVASSPGYGGLTLHQRAHVVAIHVFAQRKDLIVLDLDHESVVIIVFLPVL